MRESRPADTLIGMDVFLHELYESKAYGWERMDPHRLHSRVD